jgi:hypothetical protein
MLKRMYKAYKKFFDEKLWNGTTVVSLIAVLIVAIAGCTPNGSYLKANALEATTFVQHDDTVTINGKTFKVVLQEIN